MYPRNRMAKYLQRSCPKCNGYLGIVVLERKAKMPVQRPVEEYTPREGVSA